MEDKLRQIVSVLGGYGKVKVNEPMRNHTTFRIGGPADAYFESGSSEEIRKAVAVCKDMNIPYFVIGVGANILVSDKGIRGLVIKSVCNYLMILGPTSKFQDQVGVNSDSGSHYRPFDTARYLKFDDLDFEEPPPDTLVKIGAGVSLPVLIRWSLDQGLTGLQSFAGIPASVGGAIYNNIHGGTKLFDQFVHEVSLIDMSGRVVNVPHQAMGFSYDKSRLQKTKEVVLEVTLKLSHGDLERAEWVRSEWLRRKLVIQPQNNCPGCIFKNMSIAEAKRIGSPTVGVGWVLDEGLGLKGVRIGGISVSTQHANFFINDGSGCAKDAVTLIEQCRRQAKEKFGIELVEEIQRVGEF